MKLLSINILFFSAILLFLNHEISHICYSNDDANIYNKNTDITKNKQFNNIQTNGLDIYYDNNKEKFVFVNTIERCLYNTSLFFQRKEKCYYYQKFKKPILVPFYIFGFKTYNNIKTVEDNFCEVIYDSCNTDDWKQYFNIQDHQNDIRKYFDTHPEEYNYFKDIEYEPIFHIIKKKGELLLNKINTFNINDQKKFLFKLSKSNKKPDLICKAIQVKYNVYKVFNSLYYSNSENKDLKFLESNKLEKDFKLYITPEYYSLGVTSYACDIDRKGRVYIPDFEKKDENGFCGIVYLFDQKYIRKLDKDTILDNNIKELFNIHNNKFKPNINNHLK